jgi:CubicO group peptidase (beta-lactamase class C family)
MAAIIEIVSGTSYNDYIRQAILLPLGLREAYFRNETVPGLALGYQKPPDDPESTSSVRSAWDHGAGGLMISVPDLHMAFRNLRSGKVLSQESLEIMFHPWPDEGYGWHVRKDAEGRRLIEKSGGAVSYASHLLHYPDDQVTIIWATNSLHKRFRADLNRRLREAVLGVTVPK